MSANYLICLVNKLKEEYNNYYSLKKKYLLELNIKKSEILKTDLKESEQIISQLNDDINNCIKKYRQIIKIKEDINSEKQKEKDILEKNKKFSEFLDTGKKILINNINYYEKLPEYSNKKLKTAKISPLDLINFTLRVSKQNKSPPENMLYFQKYLPDINSQDKSILYTDYFINNKNSFLYPYPNDDFGLKNTILRYDLSNNNRLLPPILISPDPSNVNDKNEILSNKGRDLIFKYPKENSPPGIFYKYSKDPNILPSFFSGEKYKDYSRPNLDKDCVVKVCTCKLGFKDSEIVTFVFAIDDNEEIKYVTKKPENKKKGDFVVRQEDKFDSGSLRFEAMNSSSFSPQNSSRQGSSSYDPNYIIPDKIEDNSDDEYGI